MTDTEKTTERRGFLNLAGTALTMVLVYYIGQQHADNAVFFSLSGVLLLLGVPLGCITWPPTEAGRLFTPARALVSAFATIAVVVITVVIGTLMPDHLFLPPVLVGAGLLLVMHTQAP